MTPAPDTPVQRTRPFRLPLLVLAMIVLVLSLVTIAGVLLPGHHSKTIVYTQIILLSLALPFIALLFIHVRRYWRDPLDDLENWSRRIRSGDFYTPIPQPSGGALRRIVRDINTLTSELRALTEDMDNKVRAQTEHIASKSRSLEILYDIATDLSTARTLDELLSQFLKTLMILVDARAASVRLTTGNETRLVASRGLNPDIVKCEQHVPLARCLCGNIAINGGLGIQKGQAACQAFTNDPLIDGACEELVVVPIQYRDKILGVYNLFLDRPSTELGKDSRDLLNSIGKHLGLAMEKARLDDNERRIAIMEERNMIGNELHDSLAQSLVSMRLQLKMLGELLYKQDHRGVQTEVQRLRSAVEEAHESLRDLLGNFKSRMDERGLIPAIEDLVLRFKEETGIVVFLQNNWHEFSFTPMQEVQVFRIIQEALTNIRKHSNAHNVRILLRTIGSDHFGVLIEDDGLGMERDPDLAPPRPGESIGMTIMRERATRLQGELTIESEPGEGTRVELVCPLNPAKTGHTLTDKDNHARLAH